MGMGGQLLKLVVVSCVAAGCGGSGDDDDDAPDAGGVDAGSVDGAAACAEPSGEPVTHSTTIAADETWAGDVEHIVPGDLRINSATVTIEACAIVNMGEGASITVQGDPVAGDAALIAAGTAGRGVAFVRADAGAWGILRGINESSRIELHYTELRGGGEFGGQYRDPTIAMAGSSYAALPVGLLLVDNVLIEGSQGVGVYFDTNAAFADGSTQLTIEGAGDHPLAMTMLALGTIPDGTYTGNAIDEALVFGQFNVFADLTIRKRLPIRIATASLSVATLVNETTPITLTLEPGVELRFPPLGQGNPGTRVIFGGNGQVTNKVGVLIAMGTEDDPIVFTSGAASPAPGDWQGLWLDTAPGSRLDNVIIEYAGGDNGISSANCKPANGTDDAALVVGNFSDEYVPPGDLITNSVIRASGGNAINAIWVGPSFGPDLTGNGNTLEEFAECAQTYNSVTGPQACPMLGCF